MSDYRKHLVDQFENFLAEEYQQYCSRHETPESLQGIITYIVDRNLIPEMNIKKYTILKEFGPVYEGNNHHKTSAVEVLADRYNLSKRTIWGIIKYYSAQADK
ncbi:MAG: hypothetical protein R2824_02370 [Saprospiraceae bacterium]|nr:hypothetical protein [Lewinella sp.]